jgi:hypothetical protein
VKVSIASCVVWCFGGGGETTDVTPSTKKKISCRNLCKTDICVHVKEQSASYDL